MNPGLIYTENYKYTPRWPFGNDGTIQVVSLAASENILPGLLIQALPDGTCRVARDLTRLAGVSVYDPDRHDPGVAYFANEMVPILRKGAVWVAFSTSLFKAPLPLDRARLNAADGTFTTDVTGLLLTQAVWTLPQFSASVTDGSAALLEGNWC